MTIDELNNSLTHLLKDAIKDAGHYKSGQLYNSVQFNFTISDGFLNFGLDAPEYLYYLDDGEFITQFFNSDSFNSILGQFVEEEIVPLVENGIAQKLS